MNILVTGGNGQLGSELRSLQRDYPAWMFCFCDLPDLDITDSNAVDALMRTCKCNVIVNCAAYTAVDQAEQEPGRAYRVNRDGAGVLAACAKAHHALLIHISTDYVFDGNSCLPYRETDRPAPLGIYGKSKRAAEELIFEIAPSFLILRTSWLYSLYGHNFLKTMLRLGAEKDVIKVIFDQTGTPTYAGDLARAIMTILGKVRLDEQYGALYHYSNEGVCSWYDFAVAIMALKKLPCKVLPIETTEYPLPSPRPFFSVLNKSAIKRDWGLVIPYWRDSLESVLLAEEDAGL
ncbi:dTDP-4-dehydrorhamnose reductase [Chlorobium phaeobacteroides]|jgi:dTDP-4-dehydrorhamnose reductase|uniref:dTDP-4-dehydrorhamnose reductase n=1 Tax=Chlorobium phaeobacteroides (strain DSM 266 / SMG 266 / 2430) TaxID=290317 RepID=A1BHY2_CHLPD|nr:dTDP-4-dehydrorhamnose reductase [Chlorobium phaeobacteroides]ABL66009.1 dTDP-4-dehydrorhamnose reductase [Chlorobium phaeobacteroides DSM 266]MBV5326485.1 dTDP-4-dehydrorhamnose reductase [Chlorobium sp.]